MSAVADLATRVRISDPRPALCSACFAGASGDTRFVDMDAASDRGTLMSGDHIVGTVDDIHLCEACVRAAAEALGLKPELHRKQMRTIRQLELRVEHWRATAGRYQEDIDRQKEYIAQLEAGRDEG